ncbi:protein FAM200B-like [Rhopalosiphum maidis]|uniref:protein FAM200B-like n=1 Tax=Rhopalosiphum maidis TaxID=43146 RepID=UPI000EFE9065|nr:protein FAM200B-like [Rhopalosiphum maidis]
MFDETTDVSCIEQLSLTLRYVINNEVYEDFVCFVDAYRSIRSTDISGFGEIKLTGQALGHIVLDILTKDLALDLKCCVGVATDGCAVMMSEDYGAVTTVKKECSIAVYCPCFNHALNNSLAQTSKIVPIRNTIGTLKEIIAFFNASAKRHLVLENISAKQLTGLCQTRWIEIQDGVLQFKSALPKVIEALTVISKWADRNSSSKASILLAALSDSDFIISLLSTTDILKLMLPVSRLLKSTSLDLVSASSAIEGIKEIFQEKRTMCASEFHTIFLNASSLAEEIGCDIKMPRIAKTQIHRDNYPATDAE